VSLHISRPTGAKTSEKEIVRKKTTEKHWGENRSRLLLINKDEKLNKVPKPRKGKKEHQKGEKQNAKPRGPATGEIKITPSPATRRGFLGL